MLTRRRPYLLLALALLAYPACAAPTLPLPPPTALIECQPDPDGMVEVSGEARPGAFVGSLNERTEAGVIVRADLVSGAYTLRIAAEVADLITIWQFEGTQPGGQRTGVTVPDRACP